VLLAGGITTVSIVSALALTGRLRLYPIKGIINKIFYKQSPESIVADKTTAIDTDLGVQRLTVTPFGAPERGES
jgi:hypothetical protein